MTKQTKQPPYSCETPWLCSTVESVSDMFARRAPYYDTQMAGIYNGPDIAALALEESGESKDVKVLDVGSGTGLVGQALIARGFKHLVALDRSVEMMEQCASKRVYSENLLGSVEMDFGHLPDESFGACTCVGSFLTGDFVDAWLGLGEMLRLVKKGGTLVVLVNEDEMKKDPCVETMQTLVSAFAKAERQGKCEILREEVIPGYLGECAGHLFVCRKATETKL